MNSKQRAIWMVAFGALILAGNYGIAGKIGAVGVGDNANIYGQMNTPVGDFKAFDAGDFLCLALTSNGSIVQWGANNTLPPPPSGPGFIAISTGGINCLALTSDGSIVQWGNTDSLGSPPSGPGFIAIAAGEWHSLAIKSDGSIVQWGNSNAGTPPPGTDFIAIAAGGSYSYALKSDGSLIEWSSSAPTLKGTGFVAISAGGNNCVALKSDGSVAAWGSAGNGHSLQPPLGWDFVSVSVGQTAAVALRSNGSVVNLFDGSTLKGYYAKISAGGDFYLVMTPPETSTAIQGDINNDQKVDISDLVILSANWLKGTL